MEPVSRRTLLGAGVAGAGLAMLAGYLEDWQPAGAFVDPAGDEVRAAEGGRDPGAVRELRLDAVAGPVDLGGLTVTTWSYDGLVPGRPITHTDGFPVAPVDTDALLIGMGKRYDVLVTLADGVFPLVARSHSRAEAHRRHDELRLGVQQPQIRPGTPHAGPGR